ncbi:MAG: phenylalanine--tRNA ligase beta subunit [Acidimicrobiales bacterium]|nr:MAG: phenylalanine--tRNA ligase beta subunit [Acidimicrobiales bacterium]
MRVLLSWLREFTPLEASPELVGEALSDLGLAVEAVRRPAEAMHGVVVAEVAEIRPHPGADRIFLVDVDAGDGRSVRVCCGARNFAVGDRVPLALPGARIADGVEITRRRIRGEWSEGMLCAPSEVGMGSDRSGILILGDDATVGAELADVVGVKDDALFELEVNPNRPDALSVAGIARDLACRFDLPFEIPEFSVSETGEDAAGICSVAIEAPDLCGRFAVRVLESITVGRSPTKIAARLYLCGMRPINDVVDASNYVMLELGQPSHTYDLAKVPEGRLGVRRARDGEVIETLDGVTRTLVAGDGIIVDHADVPIGIAGVMGGRSTEISESTTDVLVEMAWWDPMSVARTSRRMGLRSEASVRFERGADPEIIDCAMDRLCSLLPGARVAKGMVDERGDLPARPVIRLRTRRVDLLLGERIERSRMAGILRSIGCDVDEDGEDFVVVPPSFRPDIGIEEDLVEEIARHHGYGNVRRRLPPASGVARLTRRQRERRLTRQVLLGCGLSEAMTIPFLSSDDFRRCGLDESVAVTIANPLDRSGGLLRTSLMPGLLAAVAHNEAHRNLGVSLFETGRVFRSADGRATHEEVEMLGCVLAGREAPAAVRLWATLAEALAINDWRLDQKELVGLHPTRGAEIVVGGRPVGRVGEVHPEVLEGWDVSQRVAWLEADLNTLDDAERTPRTYSPVSRHPSSDLDLAFEVAEEVPAQRVREVILSSAGELLVELHLFDVYRGPAVREGHRSLAFRLRLQARDRTLTDADVASVRDRVVSAVTSELPARLRSATD